MDTDRRESLRRSLRVLAESYAATLRRIEETHALLADEFSLDPLDYFARQTAVVPQRDKLIIDEARLTVTFQGRTCFLGSFLPFRLLSRLAIRPNCYVTHDDLLIDVWGGGIRSDAAIRSVVKVLRKKLREADLGILADAIDGSVPGRYVLKIFS